MSQRSGSFYAGRMIMMKGWIIMKKIALAALVLALTAALTVGCGSSDSSGASSAPAETKAEKPADTSAPVTTAAQETQPAPENEAPVADAPFDPATGITENMLKRSVYYEGDTSRLAAKLKKAVESDKEGISIVFMGDSITQGSGASNGKKQYTSLLTDWFKENVSPLCKFHNAGIGATDSYLGVHRAESDVFAKDPDIIFIEFINDSNDEFYKSTMDSLIRKCLSRPNDPAVVLIEMTLQGGGNCRDAHAASAKAYGVPVLSYHDAVAPEVNAGNFEFSKISGDGTHPNDIGHGWVADIVENFVSKVKSSMDSASAPVPFDPATPSPTGDRYSAARIVDLNSEDVKVTLDDHFDEGSSFWAYKNGWSTSSGGTITFELEFRNLGLLYYKSVNGKGGAAAVQVDGVNAKLIDSDFSGGWGSYAANMECYSSDEAKMHTVTVTVEDGDKPNFEILGLLVS